MRPTAEATVQGSNPVSLKLILGALQFPRVLLYNLRALEKTVSYCTISGLWKKWCPTVQSQCLWKNGVLLYNFSASGKNGVLLYNLRAQEKMVSYCTISGLRKNGLALLKTLDCLIH